MQLLSDLMKVEPQIGRVLIDISLLQVKALWIVARKNGEKHGSDSRMHRGRIKRHLSDDKRRATGPLQPKPKGAHQSKARRRTGHCSASVT